MNNKLIYSVSEIFSAELLNAGMTFSIPAYQRGYKWKKESVKRLLEDVDRFDNDGDSDQFYCLQNITLVKNDAGFNVVDGQQRLTTIMIILACLGEFDIFKGKVVYQVREESMSFISEFFSSAEGANLLSDIADWDAFKSSYHQYDFQDIFYMFSAFKEVRKWLSTNKNLDVFKEKFLGSTKLIVNLIKNAEDQILFKNLNGGKVQLDGADLIRALIITNVARQEFGDEIDTTKRIVQLNESRTRIGIQIDSIMQWWKVPEHFKYYEPIFKHFRSSDEMDFDHKVYPIDGLYKIFAILEGKTSMDLSAFEHNAIHVWPKIQSLQRTLEDWYNDKVIYHLLMFVCLYSQENQKVNIASNFIAAKQQWDEYGCTRKTFIKYLKRETYNLIKEDMGQKVIPVISKDKDVKAQYEKVCQAEDWYKDNGIYAICVLLDIIDILSPGSTLAPLHPDYFKPCCEDKEHIFPQLPVGGKINQKTIASQQTIIDTYLEMVQGIIREESKDDTFCLTIMKPHWDNDEDVTRYRDEVNAVIQKYIPINSLGNLCLLNESINRRYGNEFFSEKRVELFSFAHNGDYVRPHVFDAFDKIWLGNDEADIHMNAMKSWRKDDIIKRRMWIVEQFKEFFGDEQSEQ